MLAPLGWVWHGPSIGTEDWVGKGGHITQQSRREPVTHSWGGKGTPSVQCQPSGPRWAPTQESLVIWYFLRKSWGRKAAMLARHCLLGYPFPLRVLQDPSMILQEGISSKSLQNICDGGS